MTSRSAAPLSCVPLLLLLTTCVSEPGPPVASTPSLSLHAQFVPNLLSDPGFEAGGQGWQNVTAPGRALDNTRFHSGVAAQSITASDLQELAVFQDVSVIAESSYTASGWMASENLDTGHAILEVLWLATAGLGDSIPSTDLLGSVVVGQIGNTTDWTRVDGSFPAPVGAIAARLQLRVELEADGAGIAWFDDDSLAGMRLPDVTPPTVAITSPQAGDVLSTPTTVTANATDDGAIAGVQFRANGVELGPEISSPPYEVVLNTDTIAAGPLDLEATARDTAGNIATSTTVQVVVFHPDTTPPAVVIVSPQTGDTVRGIVTVTAQASDDGPVAGVQFLVNGANLGSEVTAPPYQAQLDTGTLPEGPADLTASARDTAGNTTVSAVVTVIVDNQAPPRLNIVLILTDDQRPETMAQMPLTMSMLGNPGVQFINGFANSPLCCPSRATILTGQFTHNHRVLSNAPPWGEPAFNDNSTIATWLSAAGYRTALIGKYLNGYNQKRPWPYQPPGWSYWAAFKDTKYTGYTLVENKKQVVYSATNPANYSTTLLGTKAVAFINSTPSTQPLFLIYAPFAPHGPATPAASDKTLFGTLPKWRPPSFNEADVSDKPLWIRQLPLMSATQISELDKFRLNQLRSLQAVDRAVRDIVNALTQTGRMSNTAIVFASDNGLAWNEHRWRGKNCFYEECIRVPFMILAPGVGPRTDPRFVTLADLAPTFAQWAGVQPPGLVNGVSLVPLLTNPSAPWRQEILVEVLAPAEPYPFEGLFSGVRTQRYAYAEHTTGELELYDLSVDPHQLTNIAADPANAALIAQLSSLLAGLKTQ